MKLFLILFLLAGLPCSAQTAHIDSAGTIGHEKDVISFTVQPPIKKHYGGFYRLVHKRKVPRRL